MFVMSLGGFSLRDAWYFITMRYILLTRYNFLVLAMFLYPYQI